MISLLETQRLKAGLTIAELARRTKLRSDILSKIEHGHRRLHIHEVATVAAALGCEPETLIPGLEANDQEEPTRV